MSSEQNYRAAEQTYTGFVGLVKWGAIGCVIVASLVVLLIA
ncbi:MAG TPA: aa3-type cytochrome c oxidase subunit IV [Sphingobium sp.]